MRVRWQGLELPSRVVLDEAASTDSFGRFVIEPFEQGFGTTIGNSLRRVLLSSLAGAAVTSVKIDGVSHEFTSMDGVLEDVTDIVLNIKGLVLLADSDEPKTLTVERNTAGEILAGDLETDPSVTIINPQHRIATLTRDVPFRMVCRMGTGRGYVVARENRSADQEVGVIPVDSIYSPVLRVRYRTEDMRVGQRTNYDRLILDIWTNKAISPADALFEAGMILRKHLSPILMMSELGEETVSPSMQLEDFGPQEHGAQSELLLRPISALNLSVRASNCLEAARITEIGQLASLSEAELLRFRSFGKTSLHEVRRKLAELGLGLGPQAIGQDDPTGEDHPVEGPAGLHEEEGSPVESDAGTVVAPDAGPVAGPMDSYTMGDEAVSSEATREPSS